MAVELVSSHVPFASDEQDDEKAACPPRGVCQASPPHCRRSWTIWSSFARSPSIGSAMVRAALI